MKTWTNACEGDRQRFKIISLALEEHPSLIDWLFKKDKPEMVSSEQKIIDDCGMFSSGEQILIELACTIWFSTKRANVFDICRRLDGKNFANCMAAMALFRIL